MHLTTNKNIICVLVFTVFVNTISAQNFSDILEKVNAYYKTASTYNIQSTYTMYRGYTGNTITESYKSTMYKTDNVVGINALGAEVITFSNAQITINSTNKTILYTKGNNIKNNVIDVNALSKFYDQTSVKEEGNNIIYEISLKQKALNIPYSKLIFHINKNDYSLIKQEFFFTSKLPFTNKKGERENDFGRMEIIYSSNPKLLKNNIQLEDYLVINSNNEVSVTNTYKNYQLINQTPNN